MNLQWHICLPVFGHCLKCNACNVHTIFYKKTIICLDCFSLLQGMVSHLMFNALRSLAKPTDPVKLKYGETIT